MGKIKPTIQLDNVSMYYHDKNSVNIGISKISLSFYKGEFVAVTGESGSGKTTLLNVIGATLGYHDGEVYYDGEPSSHFDDEDRETFRRERIGYICQNYNLIDSYTLLENVMASMIISGVDVKIAKIKGLEYLDKVGLKHIAHKKASKISSGQKQRLGIARALAKETDIILADEPTGNLDSENSRQIVDLLKSLSKDHLVIMVTHNVDEAMGKATRIIRISDGHLVLDEVKDPSCEILMPTNYDKTEVKAKKVSWIFSNFNRFAKPKRSILLALFMFIVSIATFALMGTIIANMDDVFTKNYDSAAFYNKRTDRIVLMKDDKTALTNEDIAKINNVKYVVQSDIYDLVNDFNYYTEDDITYEYYELFDTTSDGFIIESSVENHKKPLFNASDKFMRSYSCINQDKLIVGRIPEKINEIVIYGKEEDLGKKIKIFFQQKNVWSSSIHLSYDMTVVGVLEKEKYVDESQIYFSDKLCKEMVGNSLKKYNHTLAYCIDQNITKPKTIQTFIFTDSIGENNLVLSHEFFNGITKKEFTTLCSIDSTFSKDRIFNVLHVDELMSRNIIKVDESLHEKYFENVSSVQATVYIEDYAYTDEVINAINNMGYHAISSYRVSALEYNQTLLSERNMTIIICSISIFVIFILTLFVLSAFLSLNQNDYLLLRFIGMNKKTMYLTNFFEMLSTAIAMFILALGLTFILNNFEIAIIKNIIKYMVWYQFVIIFVIVFLIVIATTHKFNVGLEKKANQIIK